MKNKHPLIPVPESNKKRDEGDNPCLLCGKDVKGNKMVHMDHWLI